jgi:hypothetical protein
MQQLRAYGYQVYSGRENNHMAATSNLNNPSALDPIPSYLLKL